jgi:hypothetical protein
MSNAIIFDLVSQNYKIKWIEILENKELVADFMKIKKPSGKSSKKALQQPQVKEIV